MIARRIALEVLERVEEGGAFANAALNAALERAGVIDPRERALATELAYGTLRQTLALDWRIAQVSTRPLEELEPRVRLLLRLGAYQLFHLRIPDHAAVSETVAQAHALHLERATGFINAVLRALIRLREEALAPPLAVDPATHLLIEQGLPPWLFEAWREALPVEELAALAATIQQPAPLTLRAASPEAREAALAHLVEAGLAARPTPRSPLGILLEGAGTPEKLPGWDELGLQSQDEGAQLATLFALAEGPTPLTPGIVLDPCAAPGGKTAHLAQALPDARIFASDLHASRARRLSREIARLGLGERVEIHAADATLPMPYLDEAGVQADLLVLDAPCSGLGTLRSHPEIKLRRGPEDVTRLAGLQERLLTSLAPRVAPGGRLVFIVCTWTKEETLQQIEYFEEEHPEFEREPVVEPGAALEGLVDEEHLFATWPHRDNVDGFFGVRWRRR
ncbi:MAG: transcription antitermination factor NusB [Deltaproteobacteria bacterium]|nr:transcription antitermination factor NusB [Deltaproteobacteria bacterium]